MKHLESFHNFFPVSERRLLAFAEGVDGPKLPPLEDQKGEVKDKPEVQDKPLDDAKKADERVRDKQKAAENSVRNLANNAQIEMDRMYSQLLTPKGLLSKSVTPAEALQRTLAWARSVSSEKFGGIIKVGADKDGFPIVTSPVAENADAKKGPDNVGGGENGRPGAENVDMKKGNEKPANPEQSIDDAITQNQALLDKTYNDLSVRFTKTGALQRALASASNTIGRSKYKGVLEAKAVNGKPVIVRVQKPQEAAPQPASQDTPSTTPNPYTQSRVAAEKMKQEDANPPAGSDKWAKKIDSLSVQDFAETLVKSSNDTREKMIKRLPAAKCDSVEKALYTIANNSRDAGDRSAILNLMGKVGIHRVSNKTNQQVTDANKTQNTPKTQEELNNEAYRRAYRGN